MEAGIKGFLQKPFFVSSFRTLVEQLKGIEKETEEESELLISGVSGEGESFI